MAQSKPIRATALIVEDDALQREMISMLLEESEYEVILCETAEEALLVLDRWGRKLSLLMTDVNLAGRMTGTELAAIARSRHPSLDVVVTSGKPLSGRLPDGVKFWAKPWAALDVLREAELAQAERQPRSHKGQARSTH
jgi:two-component system, cell cycle response regulator CpdR